jgi:hypothetical protein
MVATEGDADEAGAPAGAPSRLATIEPSRAATGVEELDIRGLLD